MQKSVVFLIIIFILSGYSSVAQDLQYSQYFNAPLFLNPAFTGTAENTRFIFNYRNQWPALGKPYTTFSVSADHMIDPIKTGVGILVRRDMQGDKRLNSTEVGILGSYYVPVSNLWSFMPAIQASWFSRSLNYENFTFGDQIDMNDPANKKNTADAMATGQKMNFADFSTGGVLFSDLLWVGVTLNHLNRPDQSFGNATDRIPIKTTLSLGYKFYFEDPTTIREFREKSLIPTLIYRTQGKFDQLDVGLYGIYDPIMIGVWYRGLPIKRYSEQFSNHDAIVAMAGLNFGALAVAYSYDFTISGLTGYSKGAHEISILLEFYKPYSVKRKVRDVPCPKFYGQRKRGAVLIH